jgi:hypothetical protein
LKLQRRQKEIEMTLMERAMNQRVEQIVAKRIQAETQMREAIIEKEIEKRLGVERKKQEAIIEKEVDARIKIEMKRREELIEIEVKRRVRDAQCKMERELKEKDQKETQLDYLKQLNNVCPPVNK